MKNIQSSSQFDAGNFNFKIAGEADEPGAPNPQTDINTYKDKLLNLIPTEVIATYIFISSLIHGYDKAIPKETLDLVEWIVFALLFVVNPIYNYKVSGVTNKAQLVISTIGFAVWVFAMGGPFLTLGMDSNLTHMLGGIVLGVYTLIIPIFMKAKVA